MTIMEPIAISSLIASLASLILGAFIGFALNGGRMTGCRIFRIRVSFAESLALAALVAFVVEARCSRSAAESIMHISLFLTSAVLAWAVARGMCGTMEHRNRIEVMAGKLSYMNQTLEARVAEQIREAERAYEAERLARTELERLNDAKDQFIMITQHNLRTPIWNIRTALEDSLDGSHGAVGRRLRPVLASALASSERLMTIVDDFLDITTLKDGSSILDLAPRSLLPALESVLSDIRPDIERMGVSVSYPRCDSDWPPVIIDLSKMRECLFIVLENAVRYNRSGGTVALRTELDGSTFRLVIENTGIGISPEEHMKIGTSLFYRGREARERNPIGMGIGLSVVKAIIRAHHGSFAIASDGVGCGARATIELPLGGKEAELQ